MWVFFFYKYGNFKAFRQTKKLISNLFFLKSVVVVHVTFFGWPITITLVNPLRSLFASGITQQQPYTVLVPLVGWPLRVKLFEVTSQRPLRLFGLKAKNRSFIN